MKNARNNFYAGLFTLAGIIGFVFIILTLSGASAFATRKREYVVRFTLADGASGLKNGSSVRIGGQESGKVTSVSFYPKSDGSVGSPLPPQYVDVRVAVRRDITLYKDAAFLLELPLLGNVSSINVPAVGTADTGLLNEGDLITGRIAPPAFLQQAGFGDEQRKAVQNILTNTQTVAEDLKQITGAISGKAGTTMENINAAAADVRAVAGDTRAKIDQWSPRIDSTIRNVEAFSGNVEASRKLLDQGLERARDFLGDVQQTLSTNRTRIDSTIKSVDELTAKMNGELYQRVLATMEDAQRGVRSFSMLADGASGLVTELTPELRLASANARLASDQLKLMMTEVRRNPWRLLYQPGAKELQRELVYDAARSYAQAVSDLRAASASLEAVTAVGGGGAVSGGPLSEGDRARLVEVNRGVLDAFSNYKRAEEKFLEIIIKEP